MAFVVCDNVSNVHYIIELLESLMKTCNISSYYSGFLYNPTNKTKYQNNYDDKRHTGAMSEITMIVFHPKKTSKINWCCQEK